MRIIFLGTAAAEGYPGIFCNCTHCNEARALGGKNIRFRSAALVNNDLLIDFGPDLLAAAMRFNLNLSSVTTGLVTHAHSDHFYTSNFEMRSGSFTNHQTIPMLRLYGPTEVQQQLEKEFPNLTDFRTEPHTVHAFDRWTSGGYTFQAFHAHHALGDLEALFYSVEKDEHAFLYATDTGAFPEDTWQALMGKTFDVIILEETLGDGKYDQHMGFESFLEHADKMRSLGMLRPGGRFIAHHMSHSNNPVHEKIEAILNPHGVEVAFDGMEIVL